MTSRLIPSTILAAAVAATLGACASQPAAPQTGANFKTPPGWLDRVSVVPYLPRVDYDAPLPTGDYSNEPSRFTFKGHPLHPELLDQDQDQATADEGTAADMGAADMEAGEEEGGGEGQ